jgi:hypothetical protein
VAHPPAPRRRGDARLDVLLTRMHGGTQATARQKRTTMAATAPPMPTTSNGSARLSSRSRTWMAEGTAKGLRTAPMPAISAMLGRSPLPTMARAVNSPPAQVQVLAGHQTCLLMAVAHVLRLSVAV